MHSQLSAQLQYPLQLLHRIAKRRRALDLGILSADPQLVVPWDEEDFGKDLDETAQRLLEERRLVRNVACENDCVAGVRAKRQAFEPLAVAVVVPVQVRDGV